LRKAGSRWFDIQPGWRFICALQLIEKVGLLENERDCKVYQEALSYALNWPKPEEFLNLGAALRCEEHTVFARHRDACRSRLTDHCAFLFDPTRNETLFRRHPPILSTEGNSRFRIGGEEIVPKLLKYSMARASLMLMTSHQEFRLADAIPNIEWPKSYSKQRFLGDLCRVFPFFGSSKLQRYS
jgi:hypothetical protein